MDKGFCDLRNQFPGVWITYNCISYINRHQFIRPPLVFMGMAYLPLSFPLLPPFLPNRQALNPDAAPKVSCTLGAAGAAELRPSWSHHCALAPTLADTWLLRESVLPLAASCLSVGAEAMSCYVFAQSALEQDGLEPRGPTDSALPTCGFTAIPAVKRIPVLATAVPDLLESAVCTCS